MAIVKGIFDGKTLKSLGPIHIDRPHYVQITIQEEVEPDEEERARRRERILSYAGSWLDLGDEMWAELQRTLERPTALFPERTISW